MAEVNLLDLYPRTRRPIAERAAAAPRERTTARRFGPEYFDGARTQGYGGYRYDGRWIPVARRLRDFYGLARGDRVLDVGCAKGFLLHDLRTAVPGLHVAGLDVSAYAVSNAIGDVRPFVHVGSAVALPYPDAAFDLVLAINVIHNLARAECAAAIREIERVSRRGKYVQVDSFFTEEQRTNFERWQLTALTWFDPEGWRRLFADAGYTGDYYWTITE